jgi:hypothetical protein
MQSIARQYKAREDVERQFTEGQGVGDRRARHKQTVQYLCGKEQEYRAQMDRK